MSDQERAERWYAADEYPDPWDASRERLTALLAEQFAAVRLDEQRRLRGSEVIPLARHLAEVGRCADRVMAERKWVYRVNRISLIVRGCRLAWPDLFDEADAVERTDGS